MLHFQIISISSARKIAAAILPMTVMVMLCFPFGAGAQKTTVASGNFSNPAIWSPSGVPGTGDAVIVSQGHTIILDTDIVSSSLYVKAGGKLNISNHKTITINGTVIIDGMMDVDQGDIRLTTPGSLVRLGPAGTLVWDPADNTSAGASLFINGTEDFNASSTLIINNWYNYSGTPLGSVVTGNFGNLTISTLQGGLVYEWDQNNFFETHKILGKLTINQGWVVLDKSGSISNTVIGSVQLSNVNSYLDFHSGNHPGSFTVTTGEIVNTGGTINGLYNGNGNVNLVVNGNFTNQGNVCLIYNAGVPNTSNGNANLKITGKFTQTHGDFRGIFNITTTQSGKPDFEIGSVDMSGGIFMAQYGCHTGGSTSNIKINGDLRLNFTNPNGKFRLNGLSTMGGTANNLKLVLTIGGDLFINGNATSEIISSGSSGKETVQITGTTSFAGGNTYFNYGSHTTELTFGNAVTMTNGMVTLSKTAGTCTVVMNNNLQISGGEFNIKNGKGNANLTLLGDFRQSGGLLFMHNNSTEATSNDIYVTIYGNFTNDSGTIIFDNNQASSAIHKISFNGNTFTLGGMAAITANSQATQGNGFIYFDTQGIVNYNAFGTNVVMQNINQLISGGCVLKVVEGNLIASATTNGAKDMIRVVTGGTLDLGDHKVTASPGASSSGITTDEGGRIRISSPSGLYNGGPDAAIQASGNMAYALNRYSIIEYYGSADQVITGTGAYPSPDENQQYGIIEINKTEGRAYLNSTGVVARGGLSLKSGEFDLNNYNLTLTNGKPQALSRDFGYLKSESSQMNTSGMMIWKNLEYGTHFIPFGTDANNLLMCSFTPVNTTGGEFSISTRQCAQNNRPLPQGISNLTFNGTDGGTSKIIDRWYYISAPGLTANISLAYLPSENTVESLSTTGNFSGMVWNNNKWLLNGGTGTGSISAPFRVTMNNINTWGYYLAVANELPQPADILEFTANLKGSQVDLKWLSNANILAVSYSVERSRNGTDFEKLFDKPAMTHSATPQNFSGTDLNPLDGRSYYRLVQYDAGGAVKYSENREITYSKGSSEGIQIVNAGPNPFQDSFQLSYTVSGEPDVDIRITTVNGQLIWHETLTANPGINTFNYSADRKLTPGIYLVNLTGNGRRATLKMFKI